MKHFHFYSKQDILNMTRHRRYETKLGEKLRIIENPQMFTDLLVSSFSRYVLFGIPEDIGVKANYGVGGTDTAWQNFMHYFVNVQSTDKLIGEEVIVPGYFDFSGIRKVIEHNAKGLEETIDAYRHAVANLVDEEVEEIAKLIIAADKIPIVIGGGHNNGYPLVKGAAKSLFKAEKVGKAQINVVNADAHADFRIMEGRHSGNAFRYAMEEGWLGKYAIVALHENYNPQSMLDDLYSNVNVQYTFFEDIFLHERMNFRQAVAQAFSFADDNYIGVELDLDCVENALSSAMTPSGISSAHSRQYMNFAGNYQKIAYVHICEGAQKLQNGNENHQTGKLLAYLVSDFIKSHLGS